MERFNNVPKRCPKLLDDQLFKAPVLEYQTRIGGYGSKVFLKLSDQPKQGSFLIRRAMLKLDLPQRR